MDHKWGRSVSELGLGALGATLAACWQGFPNLVFTNAPHPVAGFFKFVIIPTDPSLAFDVTGLPKLAGHPHFPYGWPAEPDAPV